jgi:hypothetical protein
MLREYLQQKVAQAWQTAGNPNLLICVEPAAHLADGNNQRLLGLLRKAQACPDHSVVLVTAEAVLFGFVPLEKKQAEESEPASDLCLEPSENARQLAPVV